MAGYCTSRAKVFCVDAVSVLSLAKVGNKHIIALVRVEYGWTLHSWPVIRRYVYGRIL